MAALGRTYASAAAAPQSWGGALRAYDTAMAAGRRPSIACILEALKLCADTRDVANGQRIHRDAAASGELRKQPVGNTIVDMYAKCGRMEEAAQVFEALPQRSTVSWNCLIMGYAQNGQFEASLAVYGRMQEEGRKPNRVSTLGALKACAGMAMRLSNRERCLELGRRIHEEARTLGHAAEVPVGNSLIDMYSKCGSMSEARKVFNAMADPTVISWTATVMGYAENGEGNEALFLYRKMQEKGCVPNRVTLLAVLKACIALAEGGEVSRAMKVGRDVHNAIVKAGHEQNVIMANTLVNMYTKCSSMVEARRVFDGIQQRDTASWNSIVMGYARNGDGEQALELFWRMQGDNARQGLMPNALSFVAALKACASLAEVEEETESIKAASLEKTRRIHSRAAEAGLNMELLVASSLVDAYAKCCSLSDARSVFERMTKRDCVSWNCIAMAHAKRLCSGESELLPEARRLFDRIPQRDVLLITAMLLGYAQNEENQLALELYEETRGKIEADPALIAAALKAAGAMAALEAGKRIHRDASEDEAHRDNPLVVNALIDFYGKCGSMTDAERVFRASRTVKKDAAAWNSRLCGYSRQGETGKMFGVFERMRASKVEMNSITFAALLAGCSHAGLVERGMSCFASMERDFGVTPGLEHHTCIVDMLARANRFEEALAAVERMPQPLRPDEVLWTALLSSSKKWGNERVGRRAYDELVKLDPRYQGFRALTAID